MQRNTITRRRTWDGVGLVGVGTMLGWSLALAGARWGNEENLPGALDSSGPGTLGWASSVSPSWTPSCSGI